MNRISQGINWIYNRLQRKTISTAFIPQIDGLRFLAIILVVLFHANGFIVNKVPVKFSTLPTDYWLINGMFVNDGVKGVLLFFVISGFILALPFAKHFWNNAKEIDIKNYFVRRLTRLEPPYIITMVACYFAILLLKGHEFTNMFPHTFSGLFPSLLASLTYTHNLFFPGQLSINQVSWTLEIEVQFYLLVPLLVLILKLSKVWRRSLLSALIIMFTFLQHSVHVPVVTLFSFIQYFLMGFLLVDVYLSGWRPTVNSLVSFIIGSLSLFVFIYLDIRSSAVYECFFLLVLFSFCIFVLLDDFWKRIFSWRFFTTIGGMCYSIYLWHNNIISMIGNFTTRFNISHYYPLDLLWHLIILLPIVLVFSTIFYLLIEQPCMDRSWPAKLWGWLKGLFGIKPIYSEIK